MIVTAHAPNFAPGMSVMSKVAAADVVIWEDLMQFSRGGYTNRNRLTDRVWLTVPVPHGSTGLPIAEVGLVDDPHWRNETIRAMRRAWPSEATDRATVALGRPWRRLVGLNAAVLRVLCAELAPRTEWVWMSHLDSGRRRPADVSECLAAMVAEVGGTVYLSGPSGRDYLDERPFTARGIAVDYWTHRGPNPCVFEVLSHMVQEVAA